MVELQRFYTPIVTAYLTTAAFIFNSLTTQLSAPPLDRFNQILAAIGVSPLSSHGFTLSTAGCSTAELPRNFMLIIAQGAGESQPHSTRDFYTAAQAQSKVRVISVTLTFSKAARSTLRTRAETYPPMTCKLSAHIKAARKEWP